MGKLICSLCGDEVRGSLITHWQSFHKYWYNKAGGRPRFKKEGRIQSGVSR